MDTVLTITMVLVSIAVVVAIGAIRVRVEANKRKRYPFYLENCYGMSNDRIVINAHHYDFTLLDGGTPLHEFLDGDNQVIFSSMYPWTNVYRGELNGS